MPSVEGYPSAFISYSWEESAHRLWVRSLATRLRSDGVDVALDQWDAAPGDHLPAFMDAAIRQHDFVLIICTPEYKSKTDGGRGGAGYEGDIIQGHIFISQNHRKFIPILRKATWSESAPSALLGRYYIDLRDAPDYEHSYRELVLTMHGVGAERPPIREFNPLQSPLSEVEQTAPVKHRLRQYVFISTSKVETLFPQVPRDFVTNNTVKQQAPDVNPYFKVDVLSKYLAAQEKIGTAHAPKSYFGGSLKGAFLMTDDAVFFGGTLEDADDPRKPLLFVGLSGSLKHMLDERFHRLGSNVIPFWTDKLRRAGARYVPSDSSSVTFHEYLSEIAVAAERKGGKSILQRFADDPITSLKGIGASLAPLAVVLISRTFLPLWVFIAGVLISVLWAIIALLYTVITVTDIGIDVTRFGPRPALECSVKRVVNALEVWDDYEFVAKTIWVRDCAGQQVILGSPLYIALSEYADEHS